MMGKARHNLIVLAIVLAITGTASAQVFQTAKTYSLSGLLTDATELLALADVASPDGGPDGKLDIITAAQNQTVTVLAGRGDGTFTASANTVVGLIPTAMAVGDLDGDEIPDLVLGETADNLVVFLGSPDGPPFQPFGTPMAVSENPVAISLSDLNKDGDLDAVVVSHGSQSNGEVSIWRGNGDGTFSAPPSPATSNLSVGLGPTAVAVKDLNGDGVLDLAVANALSSDVSVAFGDNAGVFRVIDQDLSVASPGNPKVEPVAIDAADLNGDQRPDIVVTNSNADQIAVLDNLGNRNFAAARFFSTGSAGSNPTGLSLVDMDLDGDIDAVVPNERSSDVSVLLGDGAGQFDRPRAFVADEQTLASAVGKVNGDDLPDVIASSRSTDSPTAAVLLNLGGGALRGIEDVPSEPSPIDVIAGDFNNDGLSDLGLIHSSGHVLLFPALFDGGFAAPTTQTLGADPVAAVAGDFNGDGLLDFATANKNAGNVLVVLQRPRGGFANPRSVPIGNGIATLIAADFNRDRMLDLGVARQPGDGDGSLDVLLGQGNGNFGSARSFAVGVTPISADLGDFNEDGLVDVLVANNVSSDMALLLGSGNGTFQTARFVSVSGGPQDVAVADFDRDGCDDFVVSLPMQRNAGVYYGNCTGAFTRGSQSLDSPDSPAAVAARDITGDGVPDAMVADQVDNSISAWVKRSTANDRFFTRGSTNIYVVSRRPISLVTADFDGDGRYDLASANSFVAGSGSALTNLTATPVLRGDGNSDARVSAADIVSVLREAGDSDGSRIEEVTGSTYSAGRGVDANGDGLVTPQDARGVAGWIFRRI